MPINSLPIPVESPIAQPRRRQFGVGEDPLEGHISEQWVAYFTSQGLTVSQGSTRLNFVSPSSQSASIGATDLTSGTLSAGFYRINYYVRITQAATVSSSLTVTFDWIDGGVPQTLSGAAITGNTTTTHQELTFPILVDGASPVRYSTTYASVGGTPMQYQLTVMLESLIA